MPFDKTTFTQDVSETTAAVAAEPKLWPIYLGLVLFLVGMVASVMAFGLPGLYIPAVAFVPVMYFILIRISLG